MENRSAYGYDVGAKSTVDSSQYAYSDSAESGASVEGLYDLCNYSDKVDYVEADYSPRLSVRYSGAPGLKASTSAGNRQSLGNTSNSDSGRDSSGLAKPLKNDWNAEFQALLSRDDSAEKYLELSRLARDFVYASKLYAKIIISELYLPDSMRTIKPMTNVLQGIAGGEKYVCMSILFKFALDTKGLYGGDQNAMKSASHDLKGNLMYYNCNTRDLNVPLMALIDYRGFRVVAMSVLPVDKETIIYGSHDAGATVHTDDPVLNRKMEDAALLLNLKGHKVGGKVLHSAADIEGHRGKDGRYYLLDFARVLPPQIKTKTIATRLSGPARSSHLFELLRPELVRTNEVPLSSDALSRMGGLDPAHSVHNAEVTQASVRLFEVEIPKFAKTLDTLYAAPASVSMARPLTAGPPEAKGILASGMLVHELHSAGINCRHLGLVRANVKASQSAKVALLTEMVARVLKDETKRQLRATMQALQVPGEQPYRIVVSDYINQVFVLNPVDFWTTAIKYALIEKFSGCLSAEEFKPSWNLRQNVDLGQLIRRYQDLTGIKISQDSISVLIHASSTIDDSDLSLKAVVKNMNITAHATAAALSRKAQNAEGSEAILLFRRSVEKFKEAVSSSSNSAITFFEWGRTLSLLATKFSPALKGQSLSLWKSALQKLEVSLKLDHQNRAYHSTLVETIANYNAYDYRLWTIHHGGNYTAIGQEMAKELGKGAKSLDFLVSSLTATSPSPTTDLATYFTNFFKTLNIDRLLLVYQMTLLMADSKARVVQKNLQRYVADSYTTTLELGDGTLVSAEAIVGLLARVRSLRQLSIHSSLHLGDEHLSKLCPRLTALQELSLASCRKLSQPSLLPSCAQFGSGLTKLRVLDCGLGDGQVEALARAFPNLHALDLSGNAKLTHDGVQKLVSSPSRLKSLTELVIGSFFDRRNSQVICNFVTKDFLTADANTSLQVLDLSGTKIGAATAESSGSEPKSTSRLGRFSSSPSPDVPFASIAKYSQAIRTLILSHTAVTNAAIVAIAKKSPRLEVVVLDSCNSLTQEIIKPLAMHCPGLRRVDLSACSRLVAVVNDQHQPLQLKFFFQHCTQLDSLAVAYCQGVTAQAFEFMAADKTIYTSIQKLNFYTCKAIDEACVQFFAPKVPALTDLSLVWNPRITGKSLELLRLHCTSLQRLHLSHCSMILSAAKLGSSLPRLRVLDLAWISKGLGDDTLVSLGEHCHDLEELDVSGAEKITADGHAFLRSFVRAKKLKRFTIRKCPQISVDFLVGQLRHSNSDLRIIVDNVTKRTMHSHRLWDLSN